MYEFHTQESSSTALLCLYLGKPLFQACGQSPLIPRFLILRKSPSFAVTRLKFYKHYCSRSSRLKIFLCTTTTLRSPRPFPYSLCCAKTAQIAATPKAREPRCLMLSFGTQRGKESLHAGRTRREVKAIAEDGVQLWVGCRGVLRIKGWRWLEVPAYIVF